MPPKNILILGSTGNLGKQTVELIKKMKNYRIVGLSTNQNTEELAMQIKNFKPDFAVIAGIALAEKFKVKNCRVYRGEEWLSKCIVEEKADCVFNALSGTVGILPTLTAIRKRKKIFMANKESLAAAGKIIMKEAAKYKTQILPVDSEHSAVFQCLIGEKNEKINKILLTCSGGYRGEKENPAIDDLIKNSKWKMGEKITVDSALLMNKGFEIIEAQMLFDFPPEKIEVVIHPEAIVHSMVEFKDGNIKASLGPQDMAMPILYALNYPDRRDFLKKRLSFENLNLNFYPPNKNNFPCLDYAYKAAKMGGIMPAALVASDEAAAEYFLRGKIKFKDIPRIIREVMGRQKNIKNPTLDEILKTIEKVKKTTKEWIEIKYLKNQISR